MTAYGSLISDLETAISSGSAELCSETLWQVTDLFITGAGQYSPEHVALFDDVIGRLAAEIEVKARAKLASRLAAVDHAPPRIMKTLAFDDVVEVAAPVLAHFDQLGEDDLIANAKTKSQQHLLAISKRRALNESVTDVLVSRGNEQVVHTVTKNAGARFSDAGFGVLVKRSESDDVLAEHVGARRDIPRHHFLKLIAKASDAVRTKLAAAHPEAGQDIAHVLADVVGKIRAEAVSVSTQYDAAKQAIAERMQSGPLTEAEIYHSAKAHRFEETAVALSLICGVPIEVVETAMLEDRPDMILILARTAGLSWSTVKAILLLRTSDRGLSALDLENALKSFERLQPDTARRVVQFYRTRKQAAV
jgi:uncharacterized protein (DUF2336 family)